MRRRQVQLPIRPAPNEQQRTVADHCHKGQDERYKNANSLAARSFREKARFAQQAAIVQLGGEEHIRKRGVAIAVNKASTSENASIDRVFANFAKQNRIAIRANAPSAYCA